MVESLKQSQTSPNSLQLCRAASLLSLQTRSLKAEVRPLAAEICYRGADKRREKLWGQDPLKILPARGESWSLPREYLMRGLRAGDSERRANWE